MHPRQAKTIDEVIEILDEIISSSQKDESTKGYFAALYRKVTVSVKEGIAKGTFEDGERMEKLDVIFANRYIAAYYLYIDKEPISESWEKAFQLSSRYWPIVLQHLLIGMNAHISLDLGVAAAEVMEGKDIDNLKNDFDKINDVLASLVEEVEEDLSKIWPTLKWLLKLTGKIDTFLINFSMGIARDAAWKFAKSLANKSGEELNKLIRDRDVKVAKNSNIVSHPGFIVSSIFVIVRLGERGNVSSRISDLAN